MRKGGAEDPKRSIPGKDGELKPAEVKSHVIRAGRELVVSSRFKSLMYQKLNLHLSPWDQLARMQDVSQ